MTWEVLCKCSGKYIDIYFNLKITYLTLIIQRKLVLIIQYLCVNQSLIK